MLRRVSTKICIMLRRRRGRVNFTVTMIGTAMLRTKMTGRLFLNVVIAEGAAVFELSTSEDKALLIAENTGLGRRCELAQLKHWEV